MTGEDEVDSSDGEVKGVVSWYRYQNLSLWWLLM